MKYNTGGHVLQWNRKIGKQIGSPDEGWLLCLRCDRRWRWKDRVANLPRSKCTGTNKVALAKRVVGKTPLSHCEVRSRARDEPASSSSSRPVVSDRQGVG